MSQLKDMTLIGVAGGLTGQTLAGPIFLTVTIHNTITSSNKSESHSKNLELAHWASFFVDSGNLLAVQYRYLRVVRKDTATNDIT